MNGCSAAAVVGKVQPEGTEVAERESGAEAQAVRGRLGGQHSARGETAIRLRDSSEPIHIF